LSGGDYSFTDFDVIVFGDFNANTGDVERRLAVKGNFVAGAGWSVGYQIDNTETFVPYSLVVGGNANWASGAVYPDGSSPSTPEENIFVGGTFSGSSDLAARVSGTCSSAGCLSSYFTAAQSCYGGFQNALASNADNVQHSLSGSTITVTCNSASAMAYYLTLTGSELSQTTGYTLNGCNANAQWTINVPGTDSVTFSGGSFPPGAPQVVYNVLGSGRTITVGAIQFDGSLLAPYNILSQTGGVIIGKVVVAKVSSFVQMNKYVCYDGEAASSFYVTDK
jgi:choice-of-anchor A domain-containing protein